MTKFKRHAQGGRFKAANFGDLGLRAYREQQDRQIRHLKEQNQQDQAYSKQHLQTLRGNAASEIEHKLKSYLHHREFDSNPLSKDEIEKIMTDKKAIYNLKTDKRLNKFGDGEKLENYPLDKLPEFLQNNIDNYQDWID